MNSVTIPRRVLIGAIVIAATLVPCVAQSCVFSYNPDPIGAEVSRAYMFGANTVPNSSYSRSQYWIPAVCFQNVPTLVTDISIGVPRGSRLTHFGTLTIKIGQTTISEMSRFFEQNITGPMTTVVDERDRYWRIGPGPDWVPLGLQNPFQFLPGRGDLLLEIIHFGSVQIDVTPGFLDFAGAPAQPRGSSVSVSGPTLPTQGSGVSTSNIPRFRFCTDRGELGWMGEGCIGSNGWPLTLGVTGSPNVGGSVTSWMANAQPNTSAILTLGIDSRPPFPQDLTSVGMPGCRLYFAPLDTFPLTADSLGVGWHVLTIPNSPSLVGVVVFGQFLAVDPTANALGLVASNYGRVLIGR